jgi:hypothetical protein
MMPLPGRIFLLLSPVSQLQPDENPMASWQLPEGLQTLTPQPIATLLEPVVRLKPA